MGVSEVFDEGNSTFSADDPAFLDTVLVECPEGLAREVILDFRTAEQDNRMLGLEITLAMTFSRPRFSVLQEPQRAAPASQRPFSSR